MATLTAATAAPNQPRVPSGPEMISRHQTYVTSASVSAGDIIKFTNIKIPHGATVINCRLMGKSVDGFGTFQAGTDYSGQGAAFGSATLSVTHGVRDAAQGLPYTVSVSDDFQPRYVTAQVTVNGATTSLTASLSMTLQVVYVMDP